MKTYNILPWYLLLLIVVLCVAVMSSREGMTTLSTPSYINDSYNNNLVKQYKRRVLKDLKNEKPKIMLIILSSKYKNCISLTELQTKLNNTAPYNDRTITLILSQNDNKTNNFISKVTTDGKLSATKGLVVLAPRQTYTTNKADNQMFKDAITDNLRRLIKSNLDTTKTQCNF